MTQLPLLGLVGGVGSGKSYIGNLFAQHGAVVIDADQFAHEALRQPDIKAKLKEHWGEMIYDEAGEVDRKKLGAIVFANQSEKARLEAIVFPYIGSRIRQQIAEAGRDPKVPLAILDAALLLEAGFKSTCTALIFVDAPKAVRIERVKNRGWDAAELHRREASQWNLEKKKQFCDLVIPNFGDEVLTERLVNEAFSRYARH